MLPQGNIGEQNLRHSCEMSLYNEMCNYLSNNKNAQINKIKNISLLWTIVLLFASVVYYQNINTVSFI